MSDTAGLYRLQEFGLSDATVSTLVKKEDSFEELVKKIINRPLSFQDAQLKSSVASFLRKLRTESMNYFQGIFMLRNFGLSYQDLNVLQNTYGVDFISEAEYKVADISKSHPRLATKIKTGGSRV
ncbi:hypothetical protein [Weissella confusa]|uniref:hypothetical protein n=1 Tax=Weissella confusa TaxID=1583 RepID=UPI0022E40DED|nr:hypothetical protein [Weissella confusa]